MATREHVVDIECPDCRRKMKQDITGEYRCKKCDDDIDRMMRDMWEEAVAEGEI